MDNTNIQLLTLNVRGLKGNKKRKCILNWLKKTMCPDIIFLQETYIDKEIDQKLSKEWSGQHFHSYSSSNHSAGVSILFKPKLDLRIVGHFSSQDGRKLLLNAILNGQKLSLVNLYAPNDVQRRIEFFKNAQRWIKYHSDTDTHVIIGGDLNSIDCHRDRASGNISSCAKHLSSFKTALDVIDIWRDQHPNQNEYTYIDPTNPQKGSRIDYILTSSGLSKSVKKTYITNAPVPDHKAVVVTLREDTGTRGKGYWKINNSIIEDLDYQSEIKNIFTDTIDEYSDCANMRSVWDLCKIRFKEYSIKFSIARSRKKKNELQLLQSQLDNVDKLLSAEKHDTDLTEARRILKAQYDALALSTAQGAQVRSRAKWIEEGERSTSFFLKLEDKRQTSSRITALHTSDGKVVTNDAEILKEATSFYETLYSSKNPHTDDINTYLSNINFPLTLNAEQKESCEGVITQNECEHVMKNLKINKSPGLDGLTAEFYKAFANELTPFLTNMFNECFQDQLLPPSQRLSVLSLIFKKGETENIANYRPISLTNTDYKIIAFILANRMHHVLSDIISPDQTGYIKKRFIGQNIRLIQDIIDYGDAHNTDGVLLFLDFKKAFDSVEINYIIETLKRFNFGECFIQWITTIYTDSKSCIKNNGHISDTFDIKRGVKQGCPVSALLFNLVMETLALRIKQNVDISDIL